MPAAAPARRFVAAFVAALIYLAARPLWAAEPRVYVREFQGAGAEEAREAVILIVGESYVLIPERVFDKAAKRLDAEKNTRANMVKVAEDVGADVIVFGRVATKGKKKNKQTELRLTVREGKSGKLLARISVPWDKPAKARKQLEPQLVAAVDKAEPIGEAKTKKAMPKPRRAPQASDDDETFESDSEAAPPAASDDEEIGGSGGDSDAMEVGRSRPARRARRGVVRVESGVVKRRLAFTYQPGLDDVPWGYTGSPAAMAGASGEYVIGGGFGVEGRYAQSLGMTARLESNMAPVARLSQVEYGGGAFYRKAFGAFQLDLSVGYHKMTFAIERREGVTIDVPDVNYAYVDPGARFTLALGRHAALFVGGAYLHTLKTGQMSNASNYGGGKVIGVEGGGGLELGFGPVVMQVGGRYTRFAYVFNGSGEKATGRDDDAMLDVGGAIDSYLGGYATLGYAF